MIATRRLKAGYGDRVVLDDVSLRFRELRTCALLGPGGSGKSTLLRAIWAGGGVSAPWVDGAFHRPMGPVAYLGQQASAPTLTLADRLALESTRSPPEILSLVWTAAPEVASLLVPTLRERPEALSPELARLAELTVVLAQASALTLLDEPDSRLPPALVDAVARQLSSLRGTATFVVVTHNLAFARAVADDAILFIDGVVVEAGESARFFESPSRRRTADFLRWGA